MCSTRRAVGPQQLSVCQLGLQGRVSCKLLYTERWCWELVLASAVNAPRWSGPHFAAGVEGPASNDAVVQVGDEELLEMLLEEASSIPLSTSLYASGGSCKVSCILTGHVLIRALLYWCLWRLKEAQTQTHTSKYRSEENAA